MIYRPQTLVFVRHAESLWNAAARNGRGELKKAPPELVGIPDHLTQLSEAGKEQALKTGKALSEMFGSFDTVYYSPWKRTAETAQIIVDQFTEAEREKMKKRLLRNIFIVEQNFGDLDIGVGNPGAVEKAYEDFYKARERIGKFWTRPPNGECWWDVCMRTHTFLDIIFKPNRHKEKILVVLHGISMQTTRYHLERMNEVELVENYQEDKIKNCGTAHYEWNPTLGELGRYELKFWNRVFY